MTPEGQSGLGAVNAGPAVVLFADSRTEIPARSLHPSVGNPAYRQWMLAQPPQFHDILTYGLRTPEDVRLAWEFLRHIDPENRGHYEILNGVEIRFEDLGPTTAGCAELTVKDGLFRGPDTFAQSIVLNSRPVYAPLDQILTLAHEGRHAHYGEKAGRLPAVRTDGSFSELFATSYDCLIADEANAFHEQIITALKMGVGNITDEILTRYLPASEILGARTDGPEALLKYLRQSSYLKYKISTLKTAVLIRSGIIDVIHATDAPDDWDSQSGQLQEISRLVWTRLQTALPEFLNAAAHPKILTALTILADICKPNHVLTEQDKDFLLNDFDVLVQVVGVIFGDPVPDELKNAPRTQLDVPLDPLFANPTAPPALGKSQPITDQPEAQIARLQILARFKQLAPLSGDVGVFEAALPLVGSEEQRRILNFLYQRLSKTPDDSPQVALLCTRYGYDEAYRGLMERLTREPWTIWLQYHLSDVRRFLDDVGIMEPKTAREKAKPLWDFLQAWTDDCGLAEWWNQRGLSQHLTPSQSRDIISHAKKRLEAGHFTLEPDYWIRIAGHDQTNFPFSHLSETLSRIQQRLDDVSESTRTLFAEEIASIGRSLVKARRLLMEPVSVASRLRKKMNTGEDRPLHQPPIEKMHDINDRPLRNYLENGYNDSTPPEILFGLPFDDVLTFLSLKDPFPTTAMDFATVVKNKDKWSIRPGQEEALLRTWSLYQKRAAVLFKRTDGRGYTDPNIPADAPGIPPELAGTLVATTYEQSIPALQSQLILALALSDSPSPAWRRQGLALLDQICAHRPQGLWWCYLDPKTMSCFPTQHSDIFVARAFLKRAQITARREDLERCLSLLEDSKDMAAKIANAPDYMNLCFDLAWECQQIGDSALTGRSIQAAYNLRTAFALYLSGPTAYVGRVKLDQPDQKKIDQQHKNCLASFDAGHAQFLARCHVLNGSGADDLVEGGRCSGFGESSLLAMARVYSDAQRNDLLVATLNLTAQKMRARSEASDGSDDAGSARFDNFVKIVLDSTLSPKEKDRFILEYAQAVLEPTKKTGIGDPHLIGRTAAGLKGLLEAVRNGLCPLTETYLLKSAKEVLDQAAGPYPNLVALALAAFAPLIRDIERDHAELLDGAHRDILSAMGRGDPTVSQSLSILFGDAKTDKSPLAVLSDRLYAEALERQSAIVRDVHDASTYTSIMTVGKDVRIDVVSLGGFAEIETYLKATEGTGVLAKLGSDPDFIRLICLGNPADPQRAQIMSPLLRRAFLTAKTDDVRETAVRGLIDARYLGPYAKALFQKAGQERQNLYVLLEEACPIFQAPVPDELVYVCCTTGNRIVRWPNIVRDSSFVANVNVINRSETGCFDGRDRPVATSSRKVAALIITTLPVRRTISDQDKFLTDSLGVDQDCFQSSHTLRKRIELEIFRTTAKMPDALESLPRTLQFVVSALFHQNRDLFSRFAAYCDQHPKAPSEDLIYQLFTMADAQKLAQALANWPGLLSPEIQKALLKTQEDNRPVRQEIFEMELSRQLGGPWREHFDEIDWTTRRAGSVAEVVKARLKSTGEWVAVKVVISKRREDILAHLKQTEQLFDLVSLFSREYFGGIDPKDFAREYIESYRRELDLRNEYANVIAIQEMITRISSVSIPDYHPDYAKEGLLVMSWIEGKNVDEDLPQEAAKQAIAALWDLGLEGILISKIILDDLHTGNLRWDEARKKLVFFDLGRLTRISGGDLEVLQEYVMAIYTAGPENILNALLKICGKSTGYRRPVLERRLTEAQARNGSQSLMSRAQDFLGVVGKSDEESKGLIIDSRFTLLIKTLLTLENVSRLDPAFSAEQHLLSHIIRSAAETTATTAESASHSGLKVFPA